MQVKIRIFAAVICLFGLGCFLFIQSAQAQQNIAYVDSDYILSQMPAFEAIDEELDQLASEWEEEIEELEVELEQRIEVFQARELLYTEREREERQQEIENLRQEIEQLRERYFGPEGQLYQEQQQRLRPIQERVLEVVETVAEARDYDYVLDKSGEAVFMFARDEHNLTNDVLSELGIEIDITN